MKTLPLPSYEELHELFDLDAEKGILICKKNEEPNYIDHINGI